MTEPSPALAFLKASSDEEPALYLGAEPIADESIVSWPASAWAAFIDHYFQAAGKAAYEAGVRKGAEAAYREGAQVGAQAGAEAGIEWAKANLRPVAPPPTSTAFSGPLTIASMPARVTRRVIRRRGQGVTSTRPGVSAMGESS